MDKMGASINPIFKMHPRMHFGVSEYTALSDLPLKLDISPDLPEEMEGYGWWMHGVAPETQMRYRLFASGDGSSIGLLAHYPDYEGSELAGCGWLTLSRVLCEALARKLESINK